MFRNLSHCTLVFGVLLLALHRSSADPPECNKQCNMTKYNYRCPDATPFSAPQCYEFSEKTCTLCNGNGSTACLATDPNQQSCTISDMDITLWKAASCDKCECDQYQSVEAWNTKDLSGTTTVKKWNCLFIAGGGGNDPPPPPGGSPPP